MKIYVRTCVSIFRYVDETGRLLSENPESQPIFKTAVNECIFCGCTVPGRELTNEPLIFHSN